MYWTLRTTSLKRALPYFLLLLLLTAVLILITGFAPLRLLGGAMDMKNVNLDTPAGSFVQADAVKLFDAFAELEGEGAIDCVIACGNGRVVALCLPAGMEARAETQMQETYSWLISEGAEPRYGFRVRGELVPMEGRELEAYFDWLQRNSGSLRLAGMEGEDFREYSLPFVLRVNRLGGVELWAAYVAAGLAAAMFLTALILVAGACLGLFQLSAKLYVRRNRRALKLRTAQNDFEMGERIGDIRVGQTFTWYFSGPVTHCIKNSTLAWVYLTRRGKKRVAVLYRADGLGYELVFRSGKKAERFIEALKASECVAVFGYSQEARIQFQDFLTKKLLREGGAQ